MNKVIYPLLFFIISEISFSFGQDERLVPLSNNPVLINEWKKINSEPVSANNRMQSSVNDTLLLPFLDDFSLPTMFPRADLWKDSAVFINTDFPIHPPTIGVATFDGLNRFGNSYNSTSAGSAWCDTLTTKPLNTYDDGSGNTYSSVYLSFFYEQKGQGDRPENSDYLRLQFLDNSGVWHDTLTIFGIPAPNVKDSTFTRVQITISNPIYLYKGFRFRFRNFGSPAGNVDHWHIDYVTLKGPPNFSDINDVAYITPGHSLLNDLTAMPYTHYTNGSISPLGLMRSNLTCVMFNNDDTFDKICRFVDQIYDPTGTSIFCHGCTAGTNNFQVNHQNILNYNFPFSGFAYPSMAQSTATFDVINNIESTSGGPLDDNTQNDTIHYLQKFYNYYAHDDGTVELGYNLLVAGSSLAYKFYINKADVLHAIQFYFTQIGTSVANQLFNIEVRNDSGGQPGSVIYQKLNQIVSYSNIIDGYVTYSVNFPQSIGPGYYYFGFTQVNNIGLELGFDANIVTATSNKYFKTTGGWTQSTFAGSWMIRPVFTPYPFNVGANEMLPLNILSVYPNPASSVLHIDYNTEGRKFQYELMDASGRIIVNELLYGNSIDVSKFMNGFYILRVFDAEKKNIFQEKIIIYH